MEASKLLFVVPEQVTAEGQTEVTVSCNGQPALPKFLLTMAAAVPELFLTPDGSVQAINSDGKSANSNLSPASAGSVISLFGTGFGSYESSLASESMRLANPIEVTIDGVSADPLFAGPATDFGTQQINVRIPVTARSGKVRIDITISGKRTQNSAMVFVR